MYYSIHIILSNCIFLFLLSLACVSSYLSVIECGICANTNNNDGANTNNNDGAGIALGIIIPLAFLVGLTVTVVIVVICLKRRCYEFRGVLIWCVCMHVWWA